MYETRQERNKFYRSKEWRELREKILADSHYECLWCSQKGLSSQGKTLEVDHIKELKDYPELALEPSNLRVLCRQCHNERHHRSWANKKKVKEKNYRVGDWWQ